MFLGKEKPYVGKDKKPTQANRHVSSQPLKFGDKYNVRKLENLPFHRIKSNKIDLVMSDCLQNLEFLQAKLLATSVW